MKRILGLVLVGVFLISGCAYAWPGSGGGWGHRGGYWGHGGYFVDGALVGLAVGAYVASLPPSYTTVYYGNVPYYYSDGYYYQGTADGYVVVQPAVPVQPTPVEFEPVVWRGQTYYMHAGKWFVHTDKGYEEVLNPIK